MRSSIFTLGSEDVFICNNEKHNFNQGLLKNGQQGIIRIERCGQWRKMGPDNTVGGGVRMNEKFYDLPEEKQKRIINAGFRVFSQNSYRKSPMSEIAAAAGISKSLLFHYFRNKQELYLFLWGEGVRITLDFLKENGCYERVSLFEMIGRGIKAKVQIMRLYPDMTAFILKAYYEKDEAVRGQVQQSYRECLDSEAYRCLIRLDPEDFVPGLDLEMMYWDMYWATEGYIWEIMQRGEIDVDRMEKDFNRMLDFWKHLYSRRQ